MKNLIGVIILAVVCLGLAVVLISTKKQATVEKLKDVETILDHSNKLVKTTGDLIEQRQVNSQLTNDLTSTRTELSSTRGEYAREYANLTNKFTAVAGALSNTEATLKASQTAVAMRDQRIAALETQNRELDDKAIGLSAALTNLTAQIEDTQRKLAASEGDKAFLEKELKRMMAEKAELERQFNDLAVLRAQVSKLKEELSIARRLDWLRKGLFSDEKGAQKLMQGTPQEVRTNQFDLNVEVNADGSVSVIPPLTNAPAAPK
jgi:chromosome segregation ATPase